MTSLDTAAPAMRTLSSLGAVALYLAAIGWVVLTGERPGHWAFLPAILPIALFVAWSDLARMKIPNQAVVACAAAFMLIGPLVLPWDVFFWRLLQGAAVLVAGFVLNMARLIGAGDAKFGAAMAPYFSGGDLPLILNLFAAILLAAFVAHRTVRAFPPLRSVAPHWESWTHAKFPMGLALGPALALYLVLCTLAGV